MVSKNAARKCTKWSASGTITLIPMSRIYWVSARHRSNLSNRQFVLSWFKRSNVCQTLSDFQKNQCFIHKSVFQKLRNPFCKTQHELETINMYPTELYPGLTIPSQAVGWDAKINFHNDNFNIIFHYTDDNLLTSIMLPLT